MTRFSVKLLGASLVAGLVAASACAQPNATNAAASKAADKLAELFGDEVIVKAKTFEVKRSELDNAVLSAKGSAAAGGQVIPPADTARLEKQLLQQLIFIRLQQSRATEADKTKGREETERRMKLVLERAGSEENLVRQLKAVSLTPEEFRRRILEESTAEAVIERELKPVITEDEVKKYYEENPANFEQPETVRVSHLLLATIDLNSRQPLPQVQREAKRKIVEEALKRAKAGEVFGKLVKEYSEDPGTRERGGEMTFARGQMPAEFEAVAFTLGDGQISGVVTTPFGYHILKPIEKTPAKKIELDKVSENIKGGLAKMAVQKQLPDYFDRLTKEAGVEILDESLKPTERELAEAAAARKKAAEKK